MLMPMCRCRLLILLKGIALGSATIKIRPYGSRAHFVIRRMKAMIIKESRMNKIKQQKKEQHTQIQKTYRYMPCVREFLSGISF